jgi:hypothetical protein
MAGGVRVAVLLPVADTAWHVDLHVLPPGRLQQLPRGSHQPLQASLLCTYITDPSIDPASLLIIWLEGTST